MTTETLDNQRVNYSPDTPATPSDMESRLSQLEGFFAAFGYGEDAPIRIRALAPKGGQKLPPVTRTITRKSLTQGTTILRDLEALNATHGLYFVVNEGGDNDADVTRFAASFVESDSASISEQHSRLDAAPLLPSIRVETKKSVHAYFLIDGDCTAEEWRDVQRRLIACFDGDRNISNPSRVMRLPFFNHLSVNAGSSEVERKSVVLISFQPERRYTLEQMRDAFPTVKTSPEVSSLFTLNAAEANNRFLAGVFDPQREREIARKALESLAPVRCDERDTWRDVGYALHNTFGGDQEGFALYEAWSRQSAKFEEGACAEIWDSAGDRGISDTPITLGTLVLWSKEDSPAFVEWFDALNRKTRITQAEDRAEEIKLTDTGNAERLVLRHGRNIRHDYNRRMWLVFNGARWRENAEADVMELAKDTVRALYIEAAQISDAAQRKDAVKHAVRSEATKVLRAMIDNARSKPEIRADAGKDFDTQPHLLNVANGTIDLYTMTLRQHTREDMLTKQVQITYDPHAKAPLFESFLQRIFAGNQRMIAYIQRAIGYTLTGDVGAKCFFFCHGAGDNGKSVLLGIIHALTGEYGTAVQTETLMQHTFTSASGHNEDIAKLRGARFVSASETDEGQRLSHRQLKQLTGRDTITASRKHEKSVTFTPQFKLWIAGNEKPEINSNDQAMWNRIHRIPFDVTIPKNEQDPNLADKLKGELAGILAWAVRGAADYYREGLHMPPEVRDATKAYRTEQDTVARFIAEDCDTGESFECAAQPLYEDYRKWCAAAGEQYLDVKSFKRAMFANGFKDKRRSRSNVWLGIKPKLHALLPEDATEHDPTIAAFVSRLRPSDSLLTRQSAQGGESHVAG
jgi:P4 family phage/plasmid primase-like protien